jgi:hypothetical protein
LPEFQPWPKIARLNRDIIITEKIDGTNAAIGITEDGEVYAQSRTRLITPEDDNFGFAAWVARNAEGLLLELGPGLHFGEWWGRGIQRNYGLNHKRFSLFNVTRFGPQLHRPDLGYHGFVFEDDSVLDIVPVLYEGPMYASREDMLRDGLSPVHDAIERLRYGGSFAARGFMKPEGIVVYHTAARTMFKVTLEGDEAPKGQASA